MSKGKFAVAAVIVAIGVATAAAYVSTSGASNRAKPVRIEVFAPERGANAGANGFGWFVDMEVDFLRMNLQQAGFSGLQLTGPGVHNNVPPFPGVFFIQEGTPVGEAVRNIADAAEILEPADMVSWLEWIP